MPEYHLEPQLLPADIAHRRVTTNGHLSAGGRLDGRDLLIDQKPELVLIHQLFQHVQQHILRTHSFRNQIVAIGRQLELVISEDLLVDVDGRVIVVFDEHQLVTRFRAGRVVKVTEIVFTNYAILMQLWVVPTSYILLAVATGHMNCGTRTLETMAGCYTLPAFSPNRLVIRALSA
jgi:hypothetical protein